MGIAKLPIHYKGQVIGHALVDDYLYPQLTKRKWSLHSKGYIKATTSRYIPGQPYPQAETILLHRYIKAHDLLTSPEGTEIDHINENLWDCREINLQPVPPDMNKRLYQYRKFQL